ncbi:uracil-DNA glycosylase [Aureimonas mangrovi]|uniref:uracil-DNA glycosylase n=1 Tax=Aureimonas mangrovi TaxID=2758041 RepID=UPI00163D5B5E|nr:uracil-DNA glycosylase [Aureimonas mangrovi]
MNEAVPIAPESARAAAALLRWYREAGVDAFVADTPRDRFAETTAEAQARAERSGAARSPALAAPPIARTPPTSAAPPQSPPASATLPAFRNPAEDDGALDDARQRARTAATLDELRAALEAFHGCNLRLTARSLVFGSGAADADIMFVGEAPGREEDQTGEPFVGRSGLLLDRMLGAIGLERDAVRVTNTVPWRPPGNRSPTPAETQMCLPFVMRQIELVKPKVLVCLGSPAAKALMDTDEGIMRLRGRWNELALHDGSGTVAITAMLHPAYLLRQPTQKRLAWRDLLAIKARLD